MPTTYQRKPPVICFNCGDEMVKRRNSKTGRYYCPKDACQAERRADWMRDRTDSRVRELEDKANRDRHDVVAFLEAALRHGTATCPDCGFTNAPQGWAHLTAAGEGCGGLGTWAGRVHIEIVDAVWPPAARVYVDVP